MSYRSHTAIAPTSRFLCEGAHDTRRPFLFAGVRHTHTHTHTHTLRWVLSRGLYQKRISSIEWYRHLAGTPERCPLGANSATPAAHPMLASDARARLQREVHALAMMPPASAWPRSNGCTVSCEHRPAHSAKGACVEPQCTCTCFHAGCPAVVV